MPTALFVSPHLDDVAFSCGGTLARLSAEGWRTVLATAFTKVVPNPTGFALECQLDKGLPPEADYMSLRRDEDREFAARAGVAELRWLDHPEAPHRGYGSAADLFAGPRAGDDAWIALSDGLKEMLDDLRPEAVFAPQALGGHADHHHVVRAVLETNRAGRVLWYRDAPYAIRDPGGVPSALLPAGLGEVCVDIAPYLETKLVAAAAYGTQIGFQFGGEAAMRATLAAFAEEEARRTGRARAAEAFLAEESENDDPPIGLLVATAGRAPRSGGSG